MGWSVSCRRVTGGGSPGSSFLAMPKTRWPCGETDVRCARGGRQRRGMPDSDGTSGLVHGDERDVPRLGVAFKPSAWRSDRRTFFAVMALVGIAYAVRWTRADESPWLDSVRDTRRPRAHRRCQRSRTGRGYPRSAGADHRRVVEHSTLRVRRHAPIPAVPRSPTSRSFTSWRRRAGWSDRKSCVPMAWQFACLDADRIASVWP